MDIWSILGIAATADRQVIQAAYRAKLADTNPEDKPEEFKALRAAYEQALALAKQAASQRAPQTEGERWAARLDAVYQDIGARRSAGSWRALLGEDFCLSLATRAQARDLLLRYLMEHCFLPQEIWRLLDEFFALREKRGELLQQFPQDFIDNAVLAGIANGPLVPFGPLEGPGPACDKFLNCYGRFRAAQSKNDAEAMKSILAEMEACGAQHPYLLLCKARLALFLDEFPDAYHFCRLLKEALPGDQQTLMLQADCAMTVNDYPEAERVWDILLAEHPENAQARYNRIQCLILQKKYFEAKEAALQLLKDLPAHSLVLAQLRAINQAITPLREQTYRDNPADIDNAIELAWCYIQQEQFVQARQILDALPAQQLAGSYEYENLAAKALLGSGDDTAALPHLYAWEQAIEALPDTAENADKKSRLCEAVRLQATLEDGIGNTSQADRLYERLERQWPENLDSLHARIQRALNRKDRKTALHCAEELVRLAPGDPYNHYLLGTALFQLGRLQEAYDAFGEAMRHVGRDAGCLLYQCRILMAAGQWDDAKKLADELVQANTKGSVMDFVLARIALHEGRRADAEQLFSALAEACRKKKPPYDFSGEVFFRLAVLRQNSAPKKELLELAQEGLLFDPDSTSLLELKADALRQLEQPQSALETYLKIAALNPGHRYVYELLGRLYHFSLHDYEKAADAYRKQLQNEETAGVNNLLGLALQEIGRYDESRRAFQRAVEMTPRDPAYIANLAQLCLLQNDLNGAEEGYLRALKLPCEKAATTARLRRDLARVYFRQGRDAEAQRILGINVSENKEYRDLLFQAEGYAKTRNSNEMLRVLARWRATAAPDEGTYLWRKGDFLLRCGLPRKALAALRSGATSSHNALLTLGYGYAELGHYRLAKRALARLLRMDPDNEQGCDWYAKTLLWLGDKAGAAVWAKKGLDLLERDRGGINRALYYTRRAVYLALLGDLPAARAALEQAQAAPLCRFCLYGGCKDALWAEGFLLERAGQRDEALALYRRGAELYPDEMDFAAGIRRLDKRI